MHGDIAEAIQCGFQALDDLGCDLIGRWQQIRIVEGNSAMAQNRARITWANAPYCGPAMYS